MALADLREEYLLAGLSEVDLLADPLAQFQRWFADAQAAAVPEPNAMTLATVDADGAPDARVVLLKGLEDGGFVFYTNQASEKGRQLSGNPQACLVFLWQALQRQVRVRGEVQAVADAVADAYFASRPLGSRLSAWASPQSALVADRAELEARLHAAEARFGDAPPRPPHWGGYRLQPRTIEFWQGRANRLHDRLRYRRHAEGWQIERLGP